MPVNFASAKHFYASVLLLLAIVGSAHSQIAETSRLFVSSPAMEEGSEMPVEFTGDGEGVSPPIKWSQGPPGTQSYALSLWHAPPNDEEIKSYWVVYDIPADVTSLPRNMSGIGTVGFNDKDRQAYDPMKSKGPGTKQYHITVYALSETPQFDTKKVTRGDLLKSISLITLAHGTLDFQYTRHLSYFWWLVIGLPLTAIIVAAVWYLYDPAKPDHAEEASTADSA